MHNSICELSQEYITALFKKELSRDLSFHNLDHTKGVVKAVELIADELRLQNSEITLLKVAAWFHDSGMIKSISNHENSSTELAKNALNNWGVPMDEINVIIGCIKATKLPQSPSTLLEEVMCDADLFHLSQRDYWIKNRRLQSEFVTLGLCSHSKKDWLINNASFLNNHRYFTPYGKTVLEPLKHKHLLENEKQLNRLVEK